MCFTGPERPGQESECVLICKTLFFDIEVHDDVCFTGPKRAVDFAVGKSCEAFEKQEGKSGVRPAGAEKKNKNE